MKKYKKYKSKRVLITGALGQDGRILSHIFHKNKFKVIGLIKKNNSHKLKFCKYFINNLRSEKKIISILKKSKPSHVIHLASTNKSFSKRNGKEIHKIHYLNNLNTTKNLIKAIIKTNLNCRFIFAGSSLMYEGTTKKILKEKDNFKPLGHYGKYKVASHKYIKKIQKLHKLNSTTVILFNHDSIERSKTFLLPKIIYAFKKKKIDFINKVYSLNISGDFSHAKDICKAIYKVSISKKNIDKIILSSGKRFYFNKLIRHLAKKFKYKINNINLQKNKNKKFIGSNKLAMKEINYKPKKDYFYIYKDFLKYQKLN